MIAIIMLALSLAALSACDNNSAKEYSNAVVVPIERAERAADAANLDALKKSIETYRITNGKYPDSLDEVATGLDTSHFNYDPATGTVSIRQ